MVKQQTFEAITGLVGTGFLLFGLYQVYPPLASIVFGLMLIPWGSGKRKEGTG